MSRGSWCVEASSARNFVSDEKGPALRVRGPFRVQARLSLWGSVGGGSVAGQETHDGGVAEVEGAGPDGRVATVRPGPVPTVVALADVAEDALPAAGLGHRVDAVLLGAAGGDSDGHRDGDVFGVNGRVVVCHVCNSTRAAHKCQAGGWRAGAPEHAKRPPAH